MYYHYGDSEYNGMRNVRNIFDLSFDEDYYKPIKTNYAFDGNYIEYESKGDKDKILPIKECLHIIRPNISNIINGHKTQGESKVYSGNTVAVYKTQG